MSNSADSQEVKYLANVSSNVRRLLPHLFVRCDTCEEDCNGHRASDVRWSVTADSSVKPVPVCRDCWDDADETPCEWKELDPVEIFPR